MSKKLLIVDDDPGVINSLRRVFMDEDFSVLLFENAAQAFEILEKQTVQVVISDQKMPGMSGTDFLSIVKDKYPQIIRIMLTGRAELEDAVKAVNEGEIFRFFQKPCDTDELLFSVRQAFARYEDECEIKTVRLKENEFVKLEKSYPGITRVKRDKHGVICLEMTESEKREFEKWRNKRG